MFYHPQWIVFSIAEQSVPQHVKTGVAKGRNRPQELNSPPCSGKVMFGGKEQQQKVLPFSLPVKMDFL